MNYSHTFKNKYFVFIIGAALVSILFFCNATHRLYLFDTSIVYEYGYLLYHGYKPFTDFTTPLLPFAGLLQQVCYHLFGLNYFSGVMGAWIITIIQIATIYFTLIKMGRGKLPAITYSFLITLTSLPFIGNLYYNHLSMAFVSVVISQALYIFYVNHSKKRDNYLFIHVCIEYIMLAFIFTIKLQIGAALFVGMLFLDTVSFFFIQKKKILPIAKQLLIRIILFAVPVVLIMFLTNSNLIDYLHGIEHISVKENFAKKRITSFLTLPTNWNATIISPTLPYFLCVLFLAFNMKGKPYIKNVILFSFVFFIYMFPIIIFNIIPLSVFLRHVILMPLTAVAGLISAGTVLYIVFKMKNEQAIINLFNFAFITVVYLLSFLVIMNSLEVFNIILPITIFFILTFDYLLINETAHHTFFIHSLKPAILICILGYSIVYSMFSIRKDFWEAEVWYMNEFFLEKTKFTEEHPELHKFFKHINVSKDNYANYTLIDSVVKNSNTDNILFGTELEIFNIIYGTKPPKEWPLWYHWDLTVTAHDTARMQKIVADNKYDLIVLSRTRSHCLNTIIERDYDTIQAGENTFGVFLKRKPETVLDPTVPVERSL